MRYTAQDLKKVLSYDKQTGKLTWLVDLGGRGERSGGEAGSLCKRSGYLRVTFCGKRFMAHRLAWMLETGEFPDQHIDHADRDRANNRWENLRLATPSQNLINSSTRKDNTHGLKGVRLHKNKTGPKRWQAQIGIGRKTKSLGYHATAAEAYAAYQRAAKSLYGEFAPF